MNVFFLMIILAGIPADMAEDVLVLDQEAKANISLEDIQEVAQQVALEKEGTLAKDLVAVQGKK